MKSLQVIRAYSDAYASNDRQQSNTVTQTRFVIAVKPRKAAKPLAGEPADLYRAKPVLNLPEGSKERESTTSDAILWAASTP